MKYCFKEIDSWNKLIEREEVRVVIQEVSGIKTLFRRVTKKNSDKILNNGFLMNLIRFELVTNEINFENPISNY